MDRMETCSAGAHWTIIAWAVDFIRAARERPFAFRLLMRLAMGRHAYREFIGLIDALDRDNHLPYFSYGLEGIDYHSDPLPFDWGKQREPLPLKI